MPFSLGFSLATPSCSLPLGLGYGGSLASSSISSSLTASSRPQDSRLNHPTSAWCFSSHAVEKEGLEAELVISLPKPTLLSGLQSQGPPSSLYPSDYMRYIYKDPILEIFPLQTNMNKKVTNSN